MIRIGNLDKWQWWEPGRPLLLASDDVGARVVRVTVNCSERTLFHVEAEGVLGLIGTIEGIETFEFSATGLAQITAETDGVVMYRTEDGRDVTVELEDSPVFTRIMERPARNRAQEWAEYMMLQGQRRRDADLAASRQQMAEDMAAARAILEAAKAGAAANGGNAGANGAVPGGDAAGADGGTGGGGQPAAAAPASSETAGA